MTKLFVCMYVYSYTHLMFTQVTQLLGDSNEAKLDIQDIPCIHCWNYLMALLILFFGLLLIGFPTPHSNWFLQRLFPISDNYDNTISTESCSVPREFNIQFIYNHLGCLHLVIASGMLYSLLMIKMNGIYVSQLLSSAYSVTFVTACFILIKILKKNLHSFYSKNFSMFALMLTTNDFSLLVFS
ncbi:hypothetical protein MS3_00001578 [Schistosoma haematobium]|uniref:Uncharacterized protein n=1 Tax=Schistosoma haematobium TaxID=6185 RepID=A0A922LWS6_SCHHA|nr:hypothetical protein MS3_00001578 [Schistosoma haematobium]KAH9595589.1 hypothetical protein MS3_00001578 [Schistosoma haematobium]